MYDDLVIEMQDYSADHKLYGQVGTALKRADDRFEFVRNPDEAFGFSVIAGEGEVASRAIVQAIQDNSVPIVQECVRRATWFPREWVWSTPQEAAEKIFEIRRTPDSFDSNRARVRELYKTYCVADAGRHEDESSNLSRRYLEDVAGRNSYAALLAFLKKTRVACIMDEFTWKSYSPEASMIQLTPEGYAAQLESFKPELIFVESAWRGVDEKWTNVVHKIPDELKGILKWAHEHQVPTAFWNKEDPIHFDTFKNVAVLFDYIFTYDFNCVQRYKELTGKNNAFFLPMAVQPSMFNPIEKYERKDAICFAGSYYRRYVERTKDLDGYIKAFPAFRPIEIYDRQFGKNDPNYMMPPEYAPYIKGNLPYDQIDKAYKGYTISINLNSIKQANSIARRVFELLACNTLTVSNYSYGVVTGFGDLVITSDNADVILAKIRDYEAKPYGLEKLRLLGLRKVFSENTYTDRFAYILSKVLSIDLTQVKPSVALVACVNDADEAQRVRAAFDRQTYANRKLVLFSSRTGLGDDVCSDAGKLLERVKGADYVGALNPDDFYAEHYLEDLVLGFRYATTDAVGKGTYFSVSGRGAVRLQEKAKSYRVMNSVDLRRGLVKTGAFLSAYRGNEKHIANGDFHFKLSALSLDAFNYCDSGAGDRMGANQIAEVSDVAGIDAGFAFAEMQHLAETMNAVKSTQGDFPVVTGEALYKVAVKTKCKNVAFTFENGGMTLQSSLGKNEHVYFPITKLYKRSEIPLKDGKALIHLETGPSSSVSANLAYYFFDGKRQKIASAVCAINSNRTIDVPESAAFVSFQLRLMNSGMLEVRALNFGHKATPLPRLLDKGNVLCLTNYYPSYDNIYRNGFVHARLKFYAQRGVQVSAFQMTGTTLPQFAEFEGIKVVSGNADYLRYVLKSNNYSTVVVHFLDKDMWEVLKGLPKTTRIIVWSHGADILKYTRKLFNYQTPQALEKAKIQSEQRCAFWTSLLTNIPPNYTHVFVSEYLKNVVEQDLGLQIPRDKYEVIHNPINTELFAYERKDPSLRYKLLSIRPFASRTYANDLTIACILELAKRHDFNKFEITIIGDGLLFDEVLAPLRGFPNVHILRQYLRQTEIHEYHLKNGIFLVPSREDTQGVSRDEAMSSGLVPITNDVTAISEFVDKSCGVLSPGEDYVDMARQIGTIVDNPKLFLEMSRNAAARVRRQTAGDVIVEKELALILGTEGR